MRDIPPEAIELVKKHEGFRGIGYLCPAGVPTAGWGHTGPDVKVGKSYPRSLCEAWLKDDLREAHHKLLRVLTEDQINELNDNQYSALLSFAFNLGVGVKWRIWDCVRKKQYSRVPDELKRFVNGGGKQLPGLVRRRNDEAALWLTADDEDMVPPSTQLRLVGETPPTPAPPAPKGTMVTALIGTASTVPVAAKQITDALTPYAGASDFVAHAIAGVATIAAVAAVVVLALTWLHNHKAQH